MDNFDQLKSELTTIQRLAAGNGANGFFGQEVLRFHSIAGTLIENFNLTKTSSVDERYITHILSRSLLENYFWLIYIFDDSTKKEMRYGEVINSFKRDYLKLLNEKQLPDKDKLEPADSSWSSLPRAMNVSSMLTQVTNDYDDRLNYLYFIYRITSFDTHGKNMNVILKTVFRKDCNFPVLDLNVAVDLVANHYLVILQGLRTQGEI